MRGSPPFATNVDGSVMMKNTVQTTPSLLTLPNNMEIGWGQVETKRVAPKNPNPKTVGVSMKSDQENQVID